jgi:hypothetical protein
MAQNACPRCIGSIFSAAHTLGARTDIERLCVGPFLLLRYNFQVLKHLSRVRIASTRKHSFALSDFSTATVVIPSIIMVTAEQNKLAKRYLRHALDNERRIASCVSYSDEPG